MVCLGDEENPIHLKINKEKDQFISKCFMVEESNM